MDGIKLRQAIDDNGIKLKFICEKLGLSRQGLYKKMNGWSEFTVSETKVIQQILGLSNEERDAIFFAQEVE